MMDQFFEETKMINKTVQIIKAEPGWGAYIPVFDKAGGEIVSLACEPVIAWCITIQGCMTDEHSLTVVTPVFVTGAGEDVVGSLLADNGFCGGVIYREPNGRFHQLHHTAHEGDVLAFYKQLEAQRKERRAKKQDEK